MTTKTPPRLPQRSTTHQTDTLAVRKIFTALSENWVIRDLSERDYGIDLMLEYFNDNNPTGQVVYFQCKGTKSTIEPSGNVVKFQMPKKTLLYAELFPEPFFLVYTSTNKDGPVYFVWLQKYISHVLDKSQQNWRTETTETININIPVVNRIGDNQEKLISISDHNVLQKQSILFLSTFLFWELNYGDLMHGDLKRVPLYLEHLKQFEKCSDLIKKNNQGQLPNFLEVRKCIEVIDIPDEHDKLTIKAFHALVELIKSTVLTRDFQDEFIEEVTGDTPY
jgi:hypothetical protein